MFDEDQARRWRSAQRFEQALVEEETARLHDKLEAYKRARTRPRDRITVSIGVGILAGLFAVALLY